MTAASKALGPVITAVASAGLIGAVAFVRDVDTRLVLLEDDLSETVETMALLHPPSGGVNTAVIDDGSEDRVFTGGSARNKAGSRRRALDLLKQQADSVNQEPLKAADDDDSGGDDDSAGDDDDSSRFNHLPPVPRRET